MRMLHPVSRRIANRIIFVLSLAGILMAVYVLQSFLRQSPIVCLTNGCETVRKSPLAWPFGIPVPAFGLIGYALIAMFAFFRTMNAKRRTLFLYIVTGIASGGVLFVTWFTYTEIFSIGAICTWCAISGVNMIVIAITSWWSVFSLKQEGRSYKP